MTNENDIIAHFSLPTAHPLFLCLLWKMIIETDRINPIAYKLVQCISFYFITKSNVCINREFSDWLMIVVYY